MTTPGLDIMVAHGKVGIRHELVKVLDPRHRLVGACGTVMELFSLVRAKRPQLPVIGVQFPDGDGLDAAIELGREEPIPTVIVTIARSIELVEKAMSDHVMAYLIEPVQSNNLDAAILVAWTRFEQLRALRDEVADLRLALEHRKVIERAKGVLMAAQSISESRAFNELRRRAQNERRRMIDVAEDVLRLVDLG